MEIQRLSRSAEESSCHSEKIGKQEDTRNPSDLLSRMVETISRITEDNEDLSGTSSFFCGGSLRQQVNDTLLTSPKKDGWLEADSYACWERREEIEESCESADDISISSDVVPFSMMDDDALDEISFTRELMGYEEGFDDYDMPSKMIAEDQHEELSSRIKESYSPRMLSSPIKLLKKSSARQTRPPRPNSRRPTSRRPHNPITVKNIATLSCREGPASFSKDDSCCSTSKSSTSSFSLIKKSHRRQPSDGSAEEISWWKFHCRSRSMEGSTCSKQSQCNLCRKNRSKCKCNKIEI